LRTSLVLVKENTISNLYALLSKRFLKKNVRALQYIVKELSSGKYTFSEKFVDFYGVFITCPLSSSPDVAYKLQVALLDYRWPSNNWHLLAILVN
jgi:hypothetical protein